jgi:hypothetical protein
VEEGSMAYEQGGERRRRYGDEEYRYRDEYDTPRRYRGEGYAPGSDEGYADRERGRRGDYGRREGGSGFLERAGDEVRAWFGDDDARRRRHRDEREGGSADWGWGERAEPRRGGAWEREPVDREWARQWGYVDRAERGSRPASGSGWASQGYPSPSPGGTFTESYRDEGVRGGPAAREWTSSAGPYAGRGPRGYQRSDERIKDDVCERMCRHGQLDASDIEVLVANGEVTLHGSVTDRYAKRLAEDVAESVWGVREVHNQLRTLQGGVVSPGSPGPASQTPDQPRRAA